MEYFERIQNKRREKGLTQQQLADKIQVSRQMVTRWENGWNVPSLYYAQKLADVFGMSVGELMNGREDRPSAYTAEKRDLTAAAVWIACLSFLPMLLFLLGRYFEETVRQFLLLQGMTSALDYRKVTDRVGAIFAMTAAAVCVLLFAWWIARLVGAMRSAEDGYRRYRLYRQWNAGLVFLLLNAVALGYCATFTMIEFPLSPLPEYLGAALFALCFDLLFDIVFKKIARRYMLCESNPQLKKLNLVYLIVSAAVIVALLGLLIAIGVSRSSAAPFALWTVIGVFILVAACILLSYAAVRAGKLFADKRKAD